MAGVWPYYFGGGGYGGGANPFVAQFFGGGNNAQNAMMILSILSNLRRDRESMDFRRQQLAAEQEQAAKTEQRGLLGLLSSTLGTQATLAQREREAADARKAREAETWLGWKRYELGEKEAERAEARHQQSREDTAASMMQQRIQGMGQNIAGRWDAGMVDPLVQKWITKWGGIGQRKGAKHWDNLGDALSKAESVEDVDASIRNMITPWREDFLRQDKPGIQAGHLGAAIDALEKTAPEGIAKFGNEYADMLKSWTGRLGDAGKAMGIMDPETTATELLMREQQDVLRGVNEILTKHGFLDPTSGKYREEAKPLLEKMLKYNLQVPEVKMKLEEPAADAMGEMFGFENDMPWFPMGEPDYAGGDTEKTTKKEINRLANKVAKQRDEVIKQQLEVEKKIQAAREKDSLRMLEKDLGFEAGEIGLGEHLYGYLPFVGERWQATPPFGNLGYSEDVFDDLFDPTGARHREPPTGPSWLDRTIEHLQHPLRW